MLVSQEGRSGSRSDPHPEGTFHEPWKRWAPHMNGAQRVYGDGSG